ncbi:MAG TPA: deoxyribodipyrimidine photo-lyase [Labilithrix sp.]|nr:deoxyribodipyrimidine photo-lyase [Labilithrix sp.]
MRALAVVEGEMRYGEAVRTLVWVRGKDLRVADHAPLADAARASETIPLFVLDPYFFAPARAREIPHRIQFLLESLAELAESIARLGSRLIVVSGKSTEVVPEIARAVEADRVVGFRWSEPIGQERDRRVTKALGAIPFDLYEGETLAAPGQVLTGSGTAFSVFTPFARAFAKSVDVAAPRKAPRSLPPLPKLPRSVTQREVAVPSAAELGIERNEAIVRGGEAAARARLRAFLRGPGGRYDIGRDRMGEAGTSRLSQDLKFGTLSARTVWTTVDQALGEHPKARRAYLNELVWREFAYDVLRSSPRVLDEPFKPAWRTFPWRADEAGWRAWVEGKTGYPVVDASARQLIEEGFVHNRARMISASFLAKHLMIDFRRGEEHFMRFLTDGDWASNDLGWQWSTGCGVDAQPWFRVFNPILQGEKFDGDGAYVRRWVPELAAIGNRWIHRPWEAPAPELARAGVVLGETYPYPIVDHAYARGRFLAAGEGLRAAGRTNAGGRAKKE